MSIDPKTADDAMAAGSTRALLATSTLALLVVVGCNSDPGRTIPDTGVAQKQDTNMAPDARADAARTDTDRPDTGPRQDTDTAPPPPPARAGQFCAGGGVSKNDQFRLVHCVSPVEVGGREASSPKYRLQGGTFRALAPLGR